MNRQFQFSTLHTMSTPARTAVLVFGMVLLLPIIAMLIVAGIISSLVFGVLLLIGIINTKLRSLTGRDRQGRHNVRVRR